MQIELRDIQNWDNWPSCVTSVEQIPDAPSLLYFSREKNSHQGIRELKTLKKLTANGVNEAFLLEICELENLVYLEMKAITAENLEPLVKLQNLQTLKLSGVRKAKKFVPLVNLSGLKRLFVENAKFLSSLKFLADAHHLSAIGIEGSMWTKQKIDSLSPLSNLKELEGLFLTSVTLHDQSLKYLSRLPKLKVLECARLAPKKEFELLRKLMPDLECRWCDEYNVSKP